MPNNFNFKTWGYSSKLTSEELQKNIDKLKDISDKIFAKSIYSNHYTVNNFTASTTPIQQDHMNYKFKIGDTVRLNDKLTYYYNSLYKINEELYYGRITGFSNDSCYIFLLNKNENITKRDRIILTEDILSLYKKTTKRYII